MSLPLLGPANRQSDGSKSGPAIHAHGLGRFHPTLYTCSLGIIQFYAQRRIAAHFRDVQDLPLAVIINLE